MYKKLYDKDEDVLEKDILALQALKESRTEKNKDEVDDQIDALTEKILDSDELTKFIYSGVSSKIESMVSNLEKLRAVSRDKKDRSEVLDFLISEEPKNWFDRLMDFISDRAKEIL
jgi:hypothetical protein